MAAGQKTVMLNSLVYKRVPKGALLLLQNHTCEKLERILCMRVESRCGNERTKSINMEFMNLN